MDGTRRLVGELEGKIQQYKNEYATLIAEAQSIQSELKVLPAVLLFVLLLVLL